MAEPNSAYSFYDLILRIAKEAKIAYYGSSGTSRAMIPINEHDLECCKDVVNDGIKFFIASAPANGWRWMNRIMKVTLGTVQTEGTCDDNGDATTLVDSDLADVYDTDDEIVGYYVYDLTQEIYAAVTGYTALTGTVTVSEWLDYDDVSSSLTPADEDNYSITDVKTVEGDKCRYPLNQNFQGDIAGKITYAAETGRGHMIGWEHEANIRFQREISASTSHVVRAAVRPWRKRRWELIVDPSPTSGDTVIFPYRVGFDNLQLIGGDSSAGAATSITDDDLADLYPDDYFKGWFIYIINGTGRNSYAECSGYTSSSGKFDVADWLAVDGSAGGKDAGSNSIYYAVPEENAHPAGMQFDEAILSACLAKAEMEFDDINQGFMIKFLQVDLPKAYATDARSAPKSVGPMLPGSGGRWHDRARKNVVYKTS